MLDPCKRARKFRLTPSLIKRFENQVERAQRNLGGPHGDCWIWTGSKDKRKRPYGRIKSEGHTLLAHRVSYFYHYISDPFGFCVNHIHCDNTLCVNPSHLNLLKSIADNTKESDAKGRRKPLIGINHQNAKLTDDMVRNIRNDRKTGMTYFELAEKYNISYQYAQRVATRQVRKTVI